MEWLINRRRMMQHKAEPASYITDGLVFHLDGIDKGSTANAWTDLISGTVIQGTGVVSSQYGWDFSGSEYFSSNYTLPPNANYTVEVCFEAASTIVQQCLFIMGDATENNLLFYKVGGTVTWLQHCNTYSVSWKANTKYSISLNMDRGLINNEEKIMNDSTDSRSSTANVLYIGKRNSGIPFYGTIYSIRIYNRRLTLAEQKNNYKIDKSRFNL